MKKIIGIVLFGLLAGCNSSKHEGSNSKITLSHESQTYIKDRKLSGPIEKSVDPQGAAGPGLGSSYASRSYRQASIRNSEKSGLQGGDSSSINKNEIYGNIQSSPGKIPLKNKSNMNYTDRWDRNLINKYDMNEKDPDTTSLHSCYWRPPLRQSYCSIQ